MKKVIKLDALPLILSFPERRKIRVVQGHGCYDVFHIGHARHLQQAKEYGDILVVTVTSDRFVNKGEGRPIFNHDQRAEMVSYMPFVDFVIISDYPDASFPIGIISPQVFIKGIDYADKGTSDIERNAVNACGGKLIFTTTEKYSTTEIVSRIKNVN